MLLPSLSALRAFDAAARHGSLSRAGDELCVTHAAVSHQIRKLEQWFGAPLMTRQGRGVRLTNTGAVLARRLKPVFEEIEAACARVDQMARSGHLTVGCIPSIAGRWLIPWLPQFSARFPDVELQVAYASADQRLTDGALDVLITFGESEEPNTHVAKLFSRINKPVCSPGFLEARGPFDTTDAIAAAPLLHDDARAGWAEWFLRTDLDPEAANAGPIFQDFNLLATAVIAGHGIALCPVEVFHKEIASGDLVVLSDVATNSDSAYFVRWRPEGGPLAEAFVQWFLENTRAVQGG